MSFSPVNKTLVRYEMRSVQGVDPNAREQRKPGFFGRLLSGVGKVLGAVAAPLSFIFPPAAIAAAGMYGMGKIGDVMQAKSMQKVAEKQQQAMQPVSYPGMELDYSSMSPASFDVSSGDRQVMQVLGARGNMQTEMTTDFGRSSGGGVNI